jgi:uncharacterized protein (DUF2344 family)
MSFGPALRVGIAGLREYLDAELLLPFNAEAGVALLNRTLPEGMQISGFSFISGKERSLDSFINRYVYDIKCNTALSVTDFLGKKEIPLQRNNRLCNMKDMVEEIRQLDRNAFQLTLKDLGDVKVKLAEILNEIFGVPVDELDVTRVAMFGWDGTAWKEPMEVEEIWAAKF